MPSTKRAVGQPAENLLAAKSFKQSMEWAHAAYNVARSLVIMLIVECLFD